MLEFLQQLLSSVESFDKGFYHTRALEEKALVVETFSKKMPKYLDIQRPKASKKTKEYRKLFFESVGNPCLSFEERFKSTYNAIFQSEDFEVKYGEEETDYTLRKYLKDEYKYGDFVKNFQDRIINDLIFEPNGVYFILPNITTDKVLPTPTVEFEPAENVLFFSHEFAFIRSSKKVRLKDDIGFEKTGSQYYLFTNFHYVILTQESRADINSLSDFAITCRSLLKNENGKITAIVPFEHNCPFMPCFQIGKSVALRGSERGEIIKDSLLKPAIVFLRKSQFQWLDFASNCAYNVNGFMWAESNAQCTENGCEKGKVRVGNKLSNCPSCNGTGNSLNIQSGDIGDVVLFSSEQDGLLTGGENTIKKTSPSDKFGYINANPESAKTFWEFYQEQMRQAYFACNMESLGDTNAGDSGVKKSLDREEMNKHTIFISELVCDMLQRQLTCIAYQRLFVALSGNIDEIKKYIPFVRVPRSFDLYTKTELETSMTEMSKGGFSPLILTHTSEKLVEKEFGKESIEYKREKFINMLNPLSGISEFSQAMALELLTTEQKVLSFQLYSIVKECEREEELKQTTCELKDKVVSCKPTINAFWLLTESEQINKVMSKASAIASTVPKLLNGSAVAGRITNGKINNNN
jgi:hypothetical protein